MLAKSTNKLQSCVNSVHKWLNANKLNLNVAKTEYMFISTLFKQSNLETTSLIMIGNLPIKRVKFVKSLGVKIDEKT